MAALVDCGQTVTALVSRHAAEDLGLAEGLAVTAQFRASASHFLRDAAALPPASPSGRGEP